MCLAHQVTYAGHFARRPAKQVWLGNLNPKTEPTEVTDKPKESKPSKWVKWRTLILRCWAIDLFQQSVDSRRRWPGVAIAREVLSPGRIDDKHHHGRSLAGIHRRRASPPQPSPKTQPPKGTASQTAGDWRAHSGSC